MNNYLHTLLFLLISGYACAAEITPKQAKDIAHRFMQNKGVNTSLECSNARLIGEANSNAVQPYYVFNAGDGEGFVIVAGNDQWGSVIGYSNSGSLDLDNAPDGLKDLLQMYSVLMDNAGTDEPTHDEGEDVTAPVTIVAPLLGNIAWTQDAPFNNNCPTYTSAGLKKHYYVGCVATAMAQIMRYYQYPAQGTGSKTYHSNVGDLTADFGSTTYEWQHMPEVVDENHSVKQASALATLCSHIGIAVEMTYEAAGSGAYSQYVASAMKDYFGYANSAAYVARNYYSTSEWMQMLKAELDAERPVFYSASSDAGTGGHAFVADGYDSNDFVHINWGWGGKSNGFFMINALNPNDLGIGGGAGGYNLSQEMVIGIEPMKEGLADGQWAIYSPTRMAGVDYGESYHLMSYIENDETKAFSGQLGAALVSNGEIVKILKTDPLTFNGITQTTRINIDSRYVNMEGVSKAVGDVPDGDYQLRYAYKTNNGEWSVLRHPLGLPAYLDAHVQDGYMWAATHVMKPDVTMLSQIESDGDIYANGIARFTFRLRNNSSEMPISAIRLRLTPADGGNSIVVSDKTGSPKLYDQSEKTFTLLCQFPDTLLPGEYKVDVYEDKFEDTPFDCSEVGQTVITILPESEIPVIRHNSGYMWAAAGGGEVHQSETFAVTASMRNYAVEGNVNLLLRLKAEDGTEIPFFLVNKTFTKGELYNAQFARRLDVDPGVYELNTYYITEDGEEHPVDGIDGKAMLTVVENPDIAVVCEELDVPEEIVLGEKNTCSIRLRALKDFNRTIYIRLRQYTNTKGEILYMKSGLSMKAGDVTTLSFTYKPTIECGAYMPIIETKVNTNTYEAVGGYSNYHKDFRVVETPTQDGIQTPVATLPSANIYTITGQRVKAEQTGRGIYIVNGHKYSIK